MLEREQVVRQMIAEGENQESQNVPSQFREQEIDQESRMETSTVITKKSNSPFDPVSLKLAPNFRLTKYADLRGKASKMPTAVVEKMLSGLQNEKTKSAGDTGLGMDAMICSIRRGGLCCIQTTSTSYPMVCDPGVQGRIAAAAALSSMYAVGVTSIDHIMLHLTVSSKMTDTERDAVVPLMVKGFKEAAIEAGTKVSGGQTALNPWLTIGGVVTSVCADGEYIVPDAAQVGDVLVLSKPLGTQVAVNAYNWLENPELAARLKLIISEDEVKKAHDRAVSVMARLNRTPAILMHKYNAHGATEVGGFGLLGHASCLAKNQKNEVSFVIHNLPVIAKMSAVANSRCGSMFNLMKGEACEHSGGLLICLPRDQAAAFCKDMERMEGSQAWIIGIVEKGDRTARIIEKPRVIEVPSKERDGELW